MGIEHSVVLALHRCKIGVEGSSARVEKLRSDCCWRGRRPGGEVCCRTRFHAACRSDGLQTWHTAVSTGSSLTLDFWWTSVSRLGSCPWEKKLRPTLAAEKQANLARPLFGSVLALRATSVADTRGASLFCPRAPNRGQHRADLARLWRTARQKQHEFELQARGACV
ncbi:unnamed protein product [Ectocarpus sp. 8 AP-2014]